MKKLIYQQKNNLKPVLFIVLLFACIQFCNAQDSVAVKETISTSKVKEKNTKEKDTTAKKINHPKIAATRSAIFPGLGQIYNKKYWKLPIVYGALGTTAYVFNYNLKNYRELKQAYIGKYNLRVFNDSTEFKKIKPNLLPLTEESLRFNRDEFRKNIDYSVLFFLILWGVNVIDATVDAHLKSFDVTPDLSLKIKPGHSEMAGTNGLSLVLKIGK